MRMHCLQDDNRQAHAAVDALLSMMDADSSPMCQPDYAQPWQCLTCRTSTDEYPLLSMLEAEAEADTRCREAPLPGGAAGGAAGLCAQPSLSPLSDADFESSVVRLPLSCAVPFCESQANG